MCKTLDRQRFSDRAEALQRFADEETDDDRREQLRSLADEYRRMAEKRDQ